MAQAIDAAKIGKLLEVARELHTKTGDVIAEIDALLGGRAGIGATMKVIESAFAEAWTNRYQGTYLWTPTRDKPHLKKLAKQLGEDETIRRIANYIRNDDVFYIKTRHSFGAFVASINSHADASSPTLAAAVNGCTHTPPCRSDLEHTARRSEDLRK